MRWVSILTRIVGWLLTPLVAWAASLFGAWLLLHLAGQFSHPRHALYAALAAALMAGVASLWLWMQLLRRSPRLRHSLHVDPEGLPVIEEGPGDEDADAPAETSPGAQP